MGRRVLALLGASLVVLLGAAAQASVKVEYDRFQKRSLFLVEMPPFKSGGMTVKVTIVQSNDDDGARILFETPVHRGLWFNHCHDVNALADDDLIHTGEERHEVIFGGGGAKEYVFVDVQALEIDDMIRAKSVEIPDLLTYLPGQMQHFHGTRRNPPQ